MLKLLPILLTAIWACQGYAAELQCPVECTCKDDPFYTLTCKSLTLQNKPNIPITNFEITQSEKPIHIHENAFTNLGLDKVSTVTISNSSVISIEKNAFKKLTELNTVRIMHTNVTDIHPETFKHNTYLEKIYLHNNPLKTIDGLMSSSLSELVVTHCNLNRISIDTFKNVDRLELLDLRGNGIKNIITGVFDSLIDVVEINLENNEISQIPDTLFDKNTEIEVLSLGFNPIETISNLNAPDLDTLNLRSCKLTTLENNSFKGVESLNSLDLSNNRISKISDKAFSNLQSLATINLNGNNISEINEHVFFDNFNLEKITLDDNKNMRLLPGNGFSNSVSRFNVIIFSCRNCGLDALSEKTFSTMPALVTLHLSHNKIHDIRTGVFSHLPDLKEIDLSYNQIVTIDDDTFKNNINLVTINLAGNPIKSLHPGYFIHNTQLQNLNLHSCGLHSLWTGGISHEKLSAVKNLNISDNKIIIITKDDITIFDQLKSIDLSGNDLSCTDSYKNLVEYLTDQAVKDTEYRTHEEIISDKDELDAAQEMVASMGIWKEQAKIKCPNLEFVIKDIDEFETDEPVGEFDDKKTLATNGIDEEDEEDEDDDEDDDDEDETDDDDEYYVEIPNSDNIALHVRPRYETYSYMWLTLIFFGVLLFTLGVVANLILFIIRRRQSIVVPRLNIRPISKLKKNSGLVYQQLSEERDGVKTPVLSRFIPIPTVHNPKPNPTGPQFV